MLSDLLRSKNKDELAYICATALDLSQGKKGYKYLLQQGIRVIKTLEDRALDTQVIICQTPRNILILVPGTKSLADGYTDISGTQLLYKWTLRKRKLTKEQDSEVRDDIKKAVNDQKDLEVGTYMRSPHFGFYFSAWRMINKFNMKSELSNIGAKRRDIIIAGHSLGGAIAPFLATLLANVDLSAKEVIMLGSPAPGRSVFKAHFEKLFPQARHYTHESDIVPFSAPKIMGFKRLDKQYFINTKNKIVQANLKLLDKRRRAGRRKNRKFDLIADHRLPEYVASLKASIRA